MAITIGSFLKRTFLGLSIFVLLLVGSIVGLMFIGITVNLDFLKKGIETSAQSILERNVSVNGPIFFEFSTMPAIEVQGIQVANVVSSSTPEFASAKRTRLQINFFPLLKGKLEIADIVAEDVVLSLENSAEGVPNWEFGSESKKAETKPEQPADSEVDASEPKEPFISLNGIDNLSMKNIGVTYHDTVLNKTILFNLDNLQGRAAPGEPLSLNFNGDVQNRPYDFTVNGDSLENFLAQGKKRSWQFTVDGNAVGKKINADGGFIIEETDSQADLGFSIDDIDIGHVLSTFGLVEGLEASTGSMGVKLSFKGDSLNEILQKSSMSFEVRDARWKIVSPTSDKFIQIEDLSGDIFVEEGNAVTMKLSGVVGELPVNFLITGAPLVDYVVDQESIPLSVDAEFANSILSFGGELTLPVSSQNLSMFFEFKTDNLTNLNEIADYNLPSIGPIDLATTFQLSEKTYEMDELNLTVRESTLMGKMSLDVSGNKPQMNIEFISEQIQLDDFSGLADVFPEPPDDQATEVEDDELVDEEKEAPTEEQPVKKKNLLSKEVLNSFDADLLVKAEQVLSGPDKLGSATLKMGVEGGLLSVDPLEIHVPGGGVAVSMGYLPGENGIEFNLNADIEDFDIGVLVRRSKPESDMGGMLYLDASLQSRAPDIFKIMEYAKGNLDFGLVPENFSAGIVDLWAVNLISSIMTEVSEEEQSEINCVVVRFDMQDGIMAEEAIYMDTSNMRIAGKADVDFKERTFKVIMAPKAKKPEFFSLAVPIKVDGTFEDFGFGIGLTRLTGAVFSFVTSPLHVPIRRVFVDEVPEDGEEACRQAWTLTGDGATAAP